MGIQTRLHRPLLSVGVETRWRKGVRAAALALSLTRRQTDLHANSLWVRRLENCEGKFNLRENVVILDIFWQMLLKLKSLKKNNNCNWKKFMEYIQTNAN